MPKMDKLTSRADHCCCSSVPKEWQGKEREREKGERREAHRQKRKRGSNPWSKCHFTRDLDTVRVILSQDIRKEIATHFSLHSFPPFTFCDLVCGVIHPLSSLSFSLSLSLSLSLSFLSRLLLHGEWHEVNTIDSGILSLTWPTLFSSSSPTPTKRSDSKPGQRPMPYHRRYCCCCYCYLLLAQVVTLTFP